MECFRLEQLNFGVVWDKLIGLKCHLTQEAPDEVGGVSTLTSLRILTVISITLRCDSPTSLARKNFKKKQRNQENLKKNQTCAECSAYDYVIF